MSEIVKRNNPDEVEFSRRFTPRRVVKQVQPLSGKEPTANNTRAGSKTIGTGRRSRKITTAQKKKVIELWHTGQHSRKDIAIMLDMSEGAVSNAIYRDKRPEHDEKYEKVS